MMKKFKKTGKESAPHLLPADSVQAKKAWPQISNIIFLYSDTAFFSAKLLVLLLARSLSTNMLIE